MQISFEVGAFVIWVVGGTVGFIIWMTRISVTLDFMAKSIDSISKAVTMFESTYIRKEDSIRELAKMQMQIDALWEKHDLLKDQIMEVKNGHGG